MLVLPVDRLPPSSADRHAALRDYFCDKDAAATQTDRGWELTLDWSDDVARHVDPRLDVGLAWWDAGVARAEMPLAMRRSGRTLSALYDTWTLHSWSEWLVKRGPQIPQSVVILHVDDHRDLGSPRLFVEGGGLTDPIARSRFELDVPESVRGAILSGAVGMGSFLTPFLHRFPGAEVRHLCQPPKASKTLDHRFVLAEQRDGLIDLNAVRPAIHLEESPGTRGPGSYRITPDLDAWLDGLGRGPILLHVDMDYFNNRYDGDSDWPQRGPALDPPLDAVLGQIDALGAALLEAGLGARIEDTVIAYSPGFFPAEYWAPAAERFLPILEQLDAA